MDREPSPRLIGPVTESFPSTDEGHVNMLERIVGFLRANCCDERDIVAIGEAATEALANAVKHGNKYHSQKIVIVQYGFREDGSFFLSVTDQGKGFDPAKVPDPTAEENLGKTEGRGLLMMRHYMKVEYANKGRTAFLWRENVRRAVNDVLAQTSEKQKK